MIGMGGFAAVVSSYGMPFRLSRLGGLGEGGTDFMAGHENGNLMSRFGHNALMFGIAGEKVKSQGEDGGVVVNGGCGTIAGPSP